MAVRRRRTKKRAAPRKSTKRSLAAKKGWRKRKARSAARRVRHRAGVTANRAGGRTKRSAAKRKAPKRKARYGSKNGKVIATGIPAAPKGYFRYVQGSSVKVVRRKTGATKGHRTCR